MNERREGGEGKEGHVYSSTYYVTLLIRIVYKNNNILIQSISHTSTCTHLHVYVHAHVCGNFKQKKTHYFLTCSIY